MNPKVLIKILTPGARLPEYAKAGDSGADVRWFEDKVPGLVLPSGHTRVFYTGLAAEPPLGWEIQVRPRSGLSSKSILVHFGTIDNGYRGELGVTITNISREMYTFQRGDRIAQFVVAPISRAEWAQCENLGETERGSDGYGSTGNA